MKSGFLSKLNHPVMLAPLAGISSLPFRLINRRFGCEYAFVEMINARSLSYENKKTAELLQTAPEDRAHWGVQLVGSEIDYIKQAIDKIGEVSPRYSCILTPRVRRKK
jgi:tRNA-dihydrouridine synthase